MAIGDSAFRSTSRAAKKASANANVYNTQPPNYLAVNGGLLVASPREPADRHRYAAARRYVGQSHAVDAGPQRPDRRLCHEPGHHLAPRATCPGAAAASWRKIRTAAGWEASGRSTTTASTSSACTICTASTRFRGKTIWTRKNVGLGNDLFGDEELLFVAPAAEGETLVLAGRDGRAAGQAAHRAVQQARGHRRTRRAHLGAAGNGVRPGNARRVARRDRVWTALAGAGLESGRRLRKKSSARLQPDGQFGFCRWPMANRSSMNGSSPKRASRHLSVAIPR